jgi:hypothetical protein
MVMKYKNDSLQHVEAIMKQLEEKNFYNKHQYDYGNIFCYQVSDYDIYIYNFFFVLTFFLFYCFEKDIHIP